MITKRLLFPKLPLLIGTWSLVIGAWSLVIPHVAADHRIGDICRIKGQEENTLHGMGLVVGLKGTGDGDSKATMRALSRYMELMGHRLASNVKGQTMLEELKSVKNVAMVFVTATVPRGGAQQGDLLDCHVSALGAKSLEGGTLMLTELHGPLPGDKTVYALASGLVSIDDVSKPQSGRVSLGCQMEVSFTNEFIKDGKLILVMNKDHASFEGTKHLEDSINSQPDFGYDTADGEPVARAIDQVRIEVRIPAKYADNPALFASHLVGTRIYKPQVDTKVIINERKKAIVIGADVEIGPVAVMHKNRLIQTAQGEEVNEFVAVEPIADGTQTKLTALVTALNNLKVPAEDVIDIIKMLKHKRALFGELIIE